MRIVRVSYGYTFNLGNYQSERIDLEAEIDPARESPELARYRLKAQVLAMGGRHAEAMAARIEADKLAEQWDKAAREIEGAEK